MERVTSVLYAVWALTACGDEGSASRDGGAETDRRGGGETVRLRGGVQKGPFVIGSSVVISAVDGVGNPTGDVFNTMTFNDLGEFAVEFSYLGPVSLEADGFYYNEVQRDLSAAPITLRAWHEVTTGGAQAAYLNVITHVTYGRVRQLVIDGHDVASAVAQAEFELRAELDIGPSGFDPGMAAIHLDVLGGDTDANAYLLAVSSVLAQAQETRGGGEATLQELLNNTSTDLGPDGALSDALKDELGRAEHALDADAVMDGLRARLAMLGSDATVPDLHRMLDRDGDGLLDVHDADADGDGTPNDVDDAPYDGEVARGAWRDVAGGLAWQIVPAAPGSSWVEARDACDALVLAGAGDWRMPTIDEARALVRGCPETEPGGACGVTAACAESSCRNAACTACLSRPSEGPGLDGCFWDRHLAGACTVVYFSSTGVADSASDEVWGVEYIAAFVQAPLGRAGGDSYAVRCVRSL